MSTEEGKELDPSFTIPRRKEESQQELEQKSILANAYGATINNTTNCIFSTSSQKRTWFNANSTPGNKVYKDKFADIYDATLPKDLLLLFQPLFCKLCMFQLSGNNMAKVHYQSKNHNKKLRQWLVDYSERTGEPLHIKAKIPKIHKEGTPDYEQKHYYCEVCDLPLTGRLHAESHYMGKNHQRAVFGKKAPAGKGYYDEQGKWNRLNSANESQEECFGQDFSKKEAKVSKEFACHVCGITVTSHSQLDIHQQGHKHKKKLKAVEDAAKLEALLADGAKNGGLLLNAEDDMLSSYRTPSGQFYCKTCNLSMNSEVQFTQHLSSKKHTKKLNVPSATSKELPTGTTISSCDDIFTQL